MGKLLSIVINNNHMRIAELSEQRKGTVVTRLLTKEIPESLIEDGVLRDIRAFAELLTATLRAANIKTKRVVFSLPSGKAVSREVVFPQMAEEKLKTAIRANASEYFPIDLSDYVLGYFPISKILKDEENGDEEKAGDKSTKKSRRKKAKEKKKNKKSGRKKSEIQLRLMVVAAPNAIIQSYYDLARLSHLKMQAVDYMGNSVFQLTAHQIGEEPCLVIQLDQEHTVLTIYNKNVMVLQRNVDFGSGLVVQAVMDQKDIGYAEAEEALEQDILIHDNFDDGDEVTDSLYYLVSNINRVIEYHMGRNAEVPLEQVYIMGEGSTMSGMELLFENQFNLPVETITALKQVYVKENKGLSTKEVLKYMDNIGAIIAPVDFIPKQLEQDMRRKLEAKAYRVMILLSLFASVVIITIPATRFFTEAMDTIDLQNQLLVLEDVKPILDHYQQASLRYQDMQAVEAIVGTNNESLIRFIDTFEQLRPSNISIQSFTCNNGQINFTALAQSKKTVAKLIQQLNMIANVSEVKVSGLSSSFEGGQETVSFSATCMLLNEKSLLSGDEEVGAADEMSEVEAEMKAAGIPMPSESGAAPAPDGGSEIPEGEDMDGSGVTER